MIKFVVDGQPVDSGRLLISGSLAWNRGKDYGITRNWCFSEETRNNPDFKAICQAAAAKENA